jgi:hypothetical protein
MADERMTAAEYRRTVLGDKPAGRRKPQQRERALHIAVVDWLRSCDLTSAGVPILFSHFANERRDKRDAILQYRQGVLSGAPDLIFWLADGCVLNLELKDEQTGRLSANQKEIERSLRALGHVYVVAKSLEQVYLALRDHGIGIVEHGALRLGARHSSLE